MRDIDVRQALHATELAEFHNDNNSLVVEELGLCRSTVRVDVAVVNGALHGYEIKSDRDTLVRLPNQIHYYNKGLDFATLVVGRGHREKAEKILPDWWGVIEAVETDRHVALNRVRPAERNPQPDPYYVVQLLWKNEALAILETLSLSKGLKSKPKQIIWDILADNLSPDHLGRVVRQTLKSRTGWRSGQPQKQGDG